MLKNRRKNCFNATRSGIKKRVYKKKLYIQIANLIILEIQFAVFTNLNRLKFNLNYIHSNSSILNDVFQFLPLILGYSGPF